MKASKAGDAVDVEAKTVEEAKAADSARPVANDSPQKQTERKGEARPTLHAHLLHGNLSSSRTPVPA